MCIPTVQENKTCTPLSDKPCWSFATFFNQLRFQANVSRLIGSNFIFERASEWQCFWYLFFFTSKFWIKLCVWEPVDLYLIRIFEGLLVVTYLVLIFVRLYNSAFKLIFLTAWFLIYLKMKTWYWSTFIMLNKFHSAVINQYVMSPCTGAYTNQMVNPEEVSLI